MVHVVQGLGSCSVWLDLSPAAKGSCSVGAADFGERLINSLRGLTSHSVRVSKFTKKLWNVRDSPRTRFPKSPRVTRSAMREAKD